MNQCSILHPPSSICYPDPLAQPSSLPGQQDPRFAILQSLPGQRDLRIASYLVGLTDAPLTTVTSWPAGLPPYQPASLASRPALPGKQDWRIANFLIGPRFRPLGPLTFWPANQPCQPASPARPARFEDCKLSNKSKVSAITPAVTPNRGGL